MTTSTLYWHCATYTESNHTGAYQPPYRHQLIACAGIEVTGEDDATGQGLQANVWAIMSPEPIKPLVRTLTSAYQLRNLVTLYGNNFGLPVLWTTALQQRVSMAGFNELVQHRDLVKELSGLVAPDNGLTFDTIVDLLDLPLRPELDVLAVWESEDPTLRQRIPKRLIIDCCFVALVDVRLRLVRGEINAEYAENFGRLILEAAAEKVSMVRKTFSAQLGLMRDETPPEDEPAEDEPVVAEAAAEPIEAPEDDLDDFDEFDDVPEDPPDLVDRLEDFGSLDPGDEAADEDFDDF